MFAGRAEPGRAVRASPRRSPWRRATCSSRPAGRWVRRRGSRSRPRGSTGWTTRCGSSRVPRASGRGGSSWRRGGGRRTAPRCSAACADDGRPVALIPDSSRRYRARRPGPQHPSPGGRASWPVRLAADRRRLLPDTLPPIAPTLGGFVRFALPLIRGELWTLAADGLDLRPARPGRADRDGDRDRRRDPAGGPPAARPALRVPRRRGAGRRLVPGDPDRGAGPAPGQAGVEPAAGILGPAAQPAGAILRPVRGGRPGDPGPGAGPVDRGAGQHDHGLDAGEHLRALQRGRPVCPELAARAGRGRADGGLPRWRPPPPCGRSGSASAGSRSSGARSPACCSCCSGGISRLRVAGAEPRAFARWAMRYQQQLRQSLPLPGDRRPAGALRRRLADRRSDGHAGLRGLRLGVPERRRIPRLQCLADAGSRGGGRPGQGGHLLDRRPEGVRAIRPDPRRRARGERRLRRAGPPGGRHPAGQRLVPVHARRARWSSTR